MLFDAIDVIFVTSVCLEILMSQMQTWACYCASEREYLHDLLKFNGLAVQFARPSFKFFLLEYTYTGHLQPCLYT